MIEPERPGQEGLEHLAADEDRAARNELRGIESALSLHRARAAQALAPQSHPQFDGENCLDCGDPIPLQRLAMRRIRCTACETRNERAGTKRR